MTIHVEPTVDYETIVRESRMQRSVAIANAIASVVGAASNIVARAFAALAGRSGNRASSSANHPVDAAARR